MPDFIDNLFRRLVNKNLFTNLLTNCLFNRTNCSSKERNLFKLSIRKSLLQIFIRCFLSVVGKDDESIDGNVELFEGIELFFVVGVADDDVSPGLIEFPQMIDLWDDVLQGKILRRRSLRSFVFSVFIFLFSLFRSGFALLRLW